MKTLNSTEAVLKKALLIKKSVVFYRTPVNGYFCMYCRICKFTCILFLQKYKFNNLLSYIAKVLLCEYNRSNHQRCSMTKGVLKNFTKFTGKRPCQSLFFNKVAGLRHATLLKKRLWHRCFPVNCAKSRKTLFYRTPSDDCFWTTTSVYTLLIVVLAVIYLLKVNNRNMRKIHEICSE